MVATDYTETRASYTFYNGKLRQERRRRLEAHPGSVPLYCKLRGMRIPKAQRCVLAAERLYAQTCICVFVFLSIYAMETIAAVHAAWHAYRVCHVSDTSVLE